MLVTTESGTVYEFDAEREHVRRVNNEIVMRRDDEWLAFTFVIPPAIGASMVLALEPLGDGDMTARCTSPVTKIEDTE